MLAINGRWGAARSALVSDDSGVLPGNPDGAVQAEISGFSATR
jgi:hypothetical protein